MKHILSLSLVCGLLLSACGGKSPVPVAEEPEAHYQEITRAMDHWREIASDVAGRVEIALRERGDLRERPIYVLPPNSRPFDLAFYQLLKTELVSRAVQVSETREAGTVVMDYDVLMVYHDPSRLGFGFGLGEVSDHEISVNVRMAHNNRYVLHLSYERYINDADWPLYISPEFQEPGTGRSRTVRVINR